MIFIEIKVVGVYLKSAFCQNKQPIYMKIPQRCIVIGGLVYKILKSFYKLKQAKKLWNKTIIKFFQKIGFIPINADNYIFIIKKKRELIIIEM